MKTRFKGFSIQSVISNCYESACTHSMEHIESRVYTFVKVWGEHCSYLSSWRNGEHHLTSTILCSEGYCNHHPPQCYSIRSILFCWCQSGGCHGRWLIGLEDMNEQYELQETQPNDERMDEQYLYSLFITLPKVSSDLIMKRTSKV